MKIATLVLASVLALAGAATAATAAVAATSARDADAPCGGAVECVLWAVRCVGDALGGHACHAAGATAAAAGHDVGKVVECTKGAVRQVLAGVTPMPCDV